MQGDAFKTRRRECITGIYNFELVPVIYTCYTFSTLGFGLQWSTYIYLFILGCSHHTFCMGRTYFTNYFDFKNNFSILGFDLKCLGVQGRSGGVGALCNVPCVGIPQIEIEDRNRRLRCRGQSNISTMRRPYYHCLEERAILGVVVNRCPWRARRTHLYACNGWTLNGRTWREPRVSSSPAHSHSSVVAYMPYYVRNLLDLSFFFPYTHQCSIHAILILCHINIMWELNWTELNWTESEI